MPNTVLFKQNLDSTETLVEAPEFIEFCKQSNSPWASFFPIEEVKSTKIEFIVKKSKDPSVKVFQWSDKGQGVDSGYADTDKIVKADLNAENGQNLLESMQYEVATDLADYLANEDTNVIAKYATRLDITDTTPVGYLKSMLSAWNTLFRLRNSNNCQFFITNGV